MAQSCCEKKACELTHLRSKQASVLKAVLAINLAMFLVEFASGVFARSTALMADSLDMLGDATVYGFSLYVLHRSEKWKATAALLKGVIIIAFGISVLVEASSKLLSDLLPNAAAIGGIGVMALAANGVCLLLLTRFRDYDINMRSTWVCSRNDIVSNVGVILGGIAVGLSGSKWPDVIVGLAIALLFLRSAWPILTEAIAILRKKPESVAQDLRVVS